MNRGGTAPGRQRKAAADINAAGKAQSTGNVKLVAADKDLNAYLKANG